MRFNIGDRVICIDIENSNLLPLTLGKEYMVLESDDFGPGIDVMNDNGTRGMYFEERFRLSMKPTPMDDTEYNEIMQAQDIMR